MKLKIKKTKMKEKSNKELSIKDCEIKICSLYYNHYKNIGFALMASALVLFSLSITIFIKILSLIEDNYLLLFISIILAIGILFFLLGIILFYIALIYGTRIRNAFHQFYSEYIRKIRLLDPNHESKTAKEIESKCFKGRLDVIKKVLDSLTK